MVAEGEDWQNVELPNEAGSPSATVSESTGGATGIIAIFPFRSVFHFCIV